MTTQGQLVLDTVAQLKAARVAPGAIVLVTGAATMNDGRGGFYRWSSSATGDDDTRFYRIVTSSRSSSGRWVRIFTSTRELPHGILHMAGGLRIFIATAGVTDANGEVAVQLTDTGVAGGTPLFSEVWFDSASARPTTTTTANDVVVGSRKSLVGTLLTYRLARGASTTLGGTLLAILGLIIPGLRAPTTGTPVSIIVYGS